MAETYDNYTAESRRCLHCARPMCAVGCPIGNDIPHFLQLVAQGREGDAVRHIGHPFGEVCGYVCPHELQCQGSCVLGRRGDAVKMGTVERECFARFPYEPRRQGDAAERKSVAVVGGGVAGLTFATAMYEQGADVTVYERDELLSTLHLIPDFRLPREATARIEKQLRGKFTIVKQSVDSETLRSLAASHDVVFVATGLTERTLGVSGEHFATPYTVFLDRGGDFRQNNAALQGKTVLVVGGGNTAMDCARLAKRSGADVVVVYRRTRSDMPAFAKEIACAEQEDVRFLFNVAPTALVQEGGRLQLTLARTVSEGRGRLVLTNELTTLSCGTVVSATGGTFDKTLLHAVTAEGELLPNVYIGGDAAGGKTVAQAVADGLSCARTVLDRIQHNR